MRGLEPGNNSEDDKPLASTARSSARRRAGAAITSTWTIFPSVMAKMNHNGRIKDRERSFEVAAT